MGVDAADFDNDGDEDLFMSHLSKETNTVYVNDGSGVFEDATVAPGWERRALATPVSGPAGSTSTTTDGWTYWWSTAPWS